jgi:hypothetical protein
MRLVCRWGQIRGTFTHWGKRQLSWSANKTSYSHWNVLLLLLWEENSSLHGGEYEHDWQKFTDVSEVVAASIIRAMNALIALRTFCTNSAGGLFLKLLFAFQQALSATNGYQDQSRKERTWKIYVLNWRKRHRACKVYWQNNSWVINWKCCDKKLSRQIWM